MFDGDKVFPQQTVPGGGSDPEGLERGVELGRQGKGDDGRKSCIEKEGFLEDKDESRFSDFVAPVWGQTGDPDLSSPD